MAAAPHPLGEILQERQQLRRQRQQQRLTQRTLRQAQAGSPEQELLAGSSSPDTPPAPRQHRRTQRGLRQPRTAPPGSPGTHQELPKAAPSLTPLAYQPVMHSCPSVTPLWTPLAHQAVSQPSPEPADSPITLRTYQPLASAERPSPNPLLTPLAHPAVSHSSPELTDSPVTPRLYQPMMPASKGPSPAPLWTPLAHQAVSHSSPELRDSPGGSPYAGHGTGAPSLGQGSVAGAEGSSICSGTGPWDSPGHCGVLLVRPACARDCSSDGASPVRPRRASSGNSSALLDFLADSDNCGSDSPSVDADSAQSSPGVPWVGMGMGRSASLHSLQQQRQEHQKQEFQEGQQQQQQQERRRRQRRHGREGHQGEQQQEPPSHGWRRDGALSSPLWLAAMVRRIERREHERKLRGHRPVLASTSPLAQLTQHKTAPLDSLPAHAYAPAHAPVAAQGFSRSRSRATLFAPTAPLPHSKSAPQLAMVAEPSARRTSLNRSRQLTSEPQTPLAPAPALAPAIAAAGTPGAVTGAEYCFGAATNSSSSKRSGLKAPKAAHTPTGPLAPRAPAPQRTTTTARSDLGPGPQKSTTTARSDLGPGPQKSTTTARSDLGPGPQRTTTWARSDSAPGPQRTTSTARSESDHKAGKRLSFSEWLGGARA